MADVESNNSQEAADNTIKHVANAAEAYAKGDIHKAVTETGNAIKSAAEGFGHMSVGN
ncbi:MAG TPA: hypothetical protein VFU36_01530 [Jatrophihabitans sp.]|nr:hypothetical protein [Jatrophihabitans sp.]